MANAIKNTGHSRLKAALVLRDALAHELGFESSMQINGMMQSLGAVEQNRGAAMALAEGAYLDALKAHSNLAGSDKNILELCDGMVREACIKGGFQPRYPQYLALLFFAYWLSCQQQDSASLLARLNSYLQVNPPKLETVTPFTEADLQFTAFWMATAAGKTHVLHAVLAMLTDKKLGWQRWDRILLITPNESLSLQHANKLKALKHWDVFAYPQDGDAQMVSNLDAESVIVIDINKLSENKKGDGVTIATSVFQDGRNLVFVDEGHKGQSSEQGLWKRLQQDLAGIGSSQLSHRGLLVEFSATFGQVAEGEHAFDRYAKSILFDYAYDRFHRDLFGKDFWHVKLDGKGDAAEQAKHLTLSAALLSYWHQLNQYRDSQVQLELKEQGMDVACPLWVLLGLSVIGGGVKSGKKNTKDEGKTIIKDTADGEQTSDVLDVLNFLTKVLNTPSFFTHYLKQIKTLKGHEADLLPAEVRHELVKADATSLCERVLKTVFGWQDGDKAVFRLLKSADGELGLGLLRGDQIYYFGVVNVGDANGLKKALQYKGLTVEDDAISPSLFAGLNEDNSGINLLIGSRRFAEGWDNYRASSLTLLRLGKGEGSLIVQMFGRVVRFAGTGGNGKRLASPSNAIKPLQTAYVFGLRSGYLETFLNGLYANGVELAEAQECPTKLNFPDRFPLLSVKASVPEKSSFTAKLSGSDWVKAVNMVRLSLAANVMTAGLRQSGVSTAKAQLGIDLTSDFKQKLALVNQASLYRELQAIKRQNAWWNFEFDHSAISGALSSNKYELFGLPDTLTISTPADIARLQRTASTIVRKLFEAAYRKQEGHFSQYQPILAQDSGIPTKYKKEKVSGEEE
ncbi:MULTISPECIES: DEAD/DEAH box helicase family protein [unclassified Vibrio]|uniref:DEAD/DEAH box helicase family protein n=2 Tax=Vibrio TaxID=662 RepID=UPI00148319BE|nr:MULTISPECIES: DEAD/DEAH box helicase family protein [unclassified Vibrio]